MKFRAFHRVLASVILLLSLFPATVDVHAEVHEFGVNSSVDTSDANPGDKVCADASGQCTLRAAMEEAEALYLDEPTDVINIGFSLPYPHTIVLEDDLPLLYANVINENLYRVIIDGDYEYSGFYGTVASTTISGLQLQKFETYAIKNPVHGDDFIIDNIIIFNHGNGIALIGSESELGGGTTTIQSNYIGYDPISEEDRSNSQNGISIISEGSVNTSLIYIGGTKITEGNVISGNSSNGIYIDSASLNLSMAIRGNYIGTDDSGNIEIQNENDGIYVREFLGQLIIGGLGDFGNLISGNNMHGMTIQDATAQTLVQGNTFGTNADESAYLPNRLWDISIYDSTYLTIGGDSTSYGNVLMDGIYGTSIDHPIQHLEIKANWIGISRTGLIRSASYNSKGIELKDVTNQSVISFNKITKFSKGIVISDKDVNSNIAILNNSIYNNTILGIDLNDNGVTPNDDRDADIGPNGLQNFPIISNVEVTQYGDAKQVMFDLSLEAVPSTAYRLQVFSSPFCNQSGYGEGKQIFYSANVSTDENGYSEINEVTDWYPTNIIGPCLTATATLMDGTTPVATSEFSPGVMAWEPEKLYLPMIVR
jgi:CSLREA domain-containing protein